MHHKMKDLTGLTIYREDVLEFLEYEEAGRLLNAMLHYVNTGEEIGLETVSEKIVYNMFLSLYNNAPDVAACSSADAFQNQTSSRLKA